jgi:hypothetical protein
MTTYYWNDITCLTPRMILRGVRHSASPLLWLPLLSFFLICKLIGKRPAANFGSRRPNRLRDIPVESLPPEVSQAFQSILVNCERAGFRSIATFQSEFIGAKEGYCNLLLHSSGCSYATIVWFRIGLGQLSKAKTSFSCHSQRTDGTYLDTGSLAHNENIPELVPPGFELRNVGPGASAEEVMRAHTDRLDTESRLERFDANSLQQHLLTKLQTIFDFLVCKKFFVALTDTEVASLTKGEGATGK